MIIQSGVYGNLFKIITVFFVISSCQSPSYRDRSAESGSGYGYDDEQREEYSSDEMAKPAAAPMSRMAKQEGAPPGNAPKEKTEQKKPVRMMIYKAELYSTVDEISESAQRAKSIVSRYSGYVEKEAVQKDPAKVSFTFRIPVESFHKSLEELSAIGVVSSRKINANDITREFADLSQRLDNMNALLDRLHSILQKTTETKQKIRILNEITRLRKEVDSMEAQKKHMARQAAFSTIVLQLTAQQKMAVSTNSPIQWIRNLQPARRTLEGKSCFAIPLPEGFLDNHKLFRSREGDALYLNPEGVKIRTATITNEPEGDLKFYEKALLYEQSRFPEKVLLSGISEGRYTLTVPRQSGYNKSYYTISLMVQGDRLHILEVYYPTEESYQNASPAVEKAMGSWKINTIIDQILGVFL